MQLRELVEHLNEYLRVADISDDSVNGLQVGGPDEVSRVAFSVDGRLAAFGQAAEWNADLMIVHHGLFWGKVVPLVGPLLDRVRLLVERGIGLYAVHLPLDAHPEVGNNAELARVLGLQDREAMGEYHGEMIGFGGTLPEAASARDLAARLEEGTGYPVLRVLDGGRPARRVACVSGGAAPMAGQIAAAGYDTFVTGEISHSSLPLMEELRLNVVFGGHYATECLGVKALARHLEVEFGLETCFIDLPTQA